MGGRNRSLVCLVGVLGVLRDMITTIRVGLISQKSLSHVIKVGPAEVNETMTSTTSTTPLGNESIEWLN